MNRISSAKKNKSLCRWHTLGFGECLGELLATMLSVTLAFLLCTLSTPQLAVASECGIVVVQEEELTQNIRDEVNTALVSLLRATGRHPPAVNSNNQSEIELRAEIRKDVIAALEHTIANVTDVCDYRDEFNKLKESLKRGLREVNATMETIVETAVITTVEAAVEKVTKPIEQIRKDVNAARDELNELKESVKRDLRGVNATIENVVEAAVNTAVEAAVEKATKPIEQLLQSLLNDVALLKRIQLGQLGRTPAILASSCSEILAATPSSPSGYYWLRAGNGSSIRVYCDMTRTCGGITGGWMQVANIDMTDSSHTCPQGLKTLTSQKRLCGINISGRGCSSAMFATHGTKYTHICGKVIGYQRGATSAFLNYNGLTIDNNYVSGVSLTHGRNPRKHIWTLAAAVHEGTGYFSENCPCTNTGAQSIPPWVGQDYFCDTALEDWDRQGSISQLYPDDPLWDGRGCGPTSSCCSFNSPPWFSKQLPSPTTDDIEMRLCGRGSRNNEDVPVEMIELYILSM